MGKFYLGKMGIGKSQGDEELDSADANAHPVAAEIATRGREVSCSTGSSGQE
jgi:hypothetical protein